VNGEVAGVREPGLWAWLNVAMDTWERVVLCTGAGLGAFVGVGVAAGGLTRFTAAAYYALLLAGLVRPVALWLFALRPHRRPLEAPPPGMDQPRLTEADLVGFPLLLPATVLTVQHFTGLAWSLSALLAVLLLGLLALLTVACHRSPLRRRPGTEAVESFRRQAGEYGCVMELHGVSPTGHATLVIEAPEGPQPAWYLQYVHGEDPPADAALRMYAQLRDHGLKRGWIIAPRPPTRRLFHYAHDLHVTLATPEWFLQGLAGAARADPRCTLAPPDTMPPAAGLDARLN